MPRQQQSRLLTPEEFDAALGLPPTKKTFSPEEFDAALGLPPLQPQAQQPAQAPQGGLGAHLSGAYETLGRAFTGTALEGLGSLAGAGRIATQKLGAATGLPQEAPFFGGLEEGLTGAAKEIYPPETRGKGGPVEDIVAGAGSMAAAVPGIALGPAGAILTFGAQNGVPAYYDVLGATGDEEKATKALLFGAAVGQLEHFGAEKALGGIIKKLSGGPVGKEVKNLVLRYALGMGGEVGTEAAQTALVDLMHEHLTDEDLDNWARIKKGLLPSAILGGGSAVIDSSIERVVQERKAKGRTVAEIGPETAPGGRIPQSAAQGTQAEPAGAVPPLPGEAQAAPQGAVLPGVPEGVRPGAEAQAGIQPGGEEAQPLQRGDLAGPLEEGAVPGVPPAEGVGVPPDVGGAEAATPGGPEVRGPVGQAGEATGGPVDVPEAPQGEAEGKTTGIKNATVERELEEMGVPLPKKAERKGFVEVHAKAMETLEADSEAGAHLVEDLAAEPRAVTDEEDALLSFEANRLIRARDKAEVAFEKNPSEANKARVEKAKAEYAKAADVFDAAGRETGRGLAARKMMIARDYSLAAMERSMAQSKGDDLTPKESALVKELHKTITEKDAAIEKAKTAAELAQAQGRAEEAFNKLKREAKRGKKRKAREEEIAQTKKELDEILERMGERFKHKAAAGGGALDLQTLQDTVLAAGKAIKLGVLKFDVWAGDMVGRFGEGIRPFLKPAWDQAKSEETKAMTGPVAKRMAAGEALAESADDIRKIAASYVHDVKTAEELVDKVHDTLKNVDPNISRREVQDAISGHGIFRKLSKDETKVLLRERSGELRELSKLEDLLAGQKPAQTGFERRKLTAREAKLSDKTRALAKQLGFTARKKTVRWNVGTANEAQVAAKKAAAAIKSRKTRLQNEINSLNERVKAQDFGPKKKPEPQLDAETVKLMAERESAKRRFESAKAKLERTRRGVPKKVLDFVTDIIGASVALTSAFDLSAVRRQGGMLTSAHPIRSVGHFKEMLAAASSPNVALATDVKIRNRPGHNFSEASKLELTGLDEELGPVEEAIHSRLISKIPILGEGVLASNRAYVTYLNLQRSQAFDTIAGTLPGPKATLDEGKDLAYTINILSGRAGGKRGKAVATALAKIRYFYAPNWVVSRFQVAYEPFRILMPGKMTGRVRRAIGKQLARYAAGQSAYYGILASLAWAAADALDEEMDIEANPLSSGFGDIRIGDLHFNPFSGMTQAISFIAKEVTGYKKTTEGKVVKLKKGGPYDQTRADVALRLLRSRANPVAGTIWSLADEQTYGGDKPTLYTEAPIPLSVRDYIESMQAIGVPAGVIASTLALIGDSVQSWEDHKKKQIRYK